MRSFKTFAEFLEDREAESRGTDPILAGDDFGVTGVDPAQPGTIGDQDQYAERSFFRGLFKVVNPVRPVSPLNSRLLASPIRKRLKSQVIGR